MGGGGGLEKPKILRFLIKIEETENDQNYRYVIFGRLFSFVMGSLRDRLKCPNVIFD